MPLSFNPGLQSLTQIIKNSHLPVCKKCVYYRHVKNSTINGKCTKFGYANIVTGDIHYEHAQISRNREDMCGEKGLYHTTAVDGTLSHTITKII